MGHADGAVFLLDTGSQMDAERQFLADEDCSGDWYHPFCRQRMSEANGYGAGYQELTGAL